ncbi:UDP-N-acetylgalactosamine-undecaprenyl-phosphate N-acetylgalactosaminephosphotransferase [bacterium HR15]|nr:UDP-N-acetylgalactosamine-undecaprenyl-phosphate N-acetylgalactosaminephosphotransferase [bacterium HR15]
MSERGSEGSAVTTLIVYEVLKRTLDIIVAGLGLLLLLPLMGIIALAIKLDSPGSVFFAHERVGQHGRKFKVLKFRTMMQDAPRRGGAITTKHDPRITRIGRILRKTKLDELPQLWNVLKGEMSLVGPRPEVEKYVQLWEPTLRNIVLSVPPGITGLTQIRYRHEEALLAQQPDPEKYYCEVLLPLKLASDMEYVQRRSLAFDLYLLVRTIRALFERE